MSSDSNTAVPGDVQRFDLELTGSKDRLAARLYITSRCRAKRHQLIVYFHSGGFTGGTIDEAENLLSHLVKESSTRVAVSASYSLAPAYPFPTAAEDAYAVLIWLRHNAERLAWSGKQLIVVGVEAGANLAAAVSLMARDRGKPLLDGQVLVMPMLDACLSSCSMRELPRSLDKAILIDKLVCECAASYRAYLPNAADRLHPYASPLQSSRLKNLPTALILTSEDDPLRDEAEYYGAKLLRSGVTTTMKRLAALSAGAQSRRSDICLSATADIINFLDGIEKAKK